MVYIFYNSVNGAIVKAYHESCYPNIPEPNIQVNNETWHQVQVENREAHVDLESKQLVIGDVKPIPEYPSKYSKLSLIQELKKLNIWKEVKAYINEADLMDEWDACTYLADNDNVFRSMRVALINKYPTIDVDDLLSRCKY